MDRETIAALDRLRTRAGLLRDSAEYKLIGQIIAGGKLQPADAIRVRNYAQQQGTTLPANFLSFVSANNNGETGAVPDTGQAAGAQPAVTSGSGQQATAGILAQARAAAQAAVAGNGGGDRPASPLNNGAVPYNQPVQGNGAVPTTAGASLPNTGAGAGSTFAPTSGGDPSAIAAQGQVLADDDKRFLRYIMQQAGFNPDRLNSFSKIAGRALLPLMQAARGAYGIAGDHDVSGLPAFIADLAHRYTTGGGNFFGNLRDFGNQTIGSADFQNAIAGVGDSEKVAAMYQSLLPLRFAGSNPLIQQAAADTFERTQNQFDDQIFNAGGRTENLPGNGVFNDWLQAQNQQLDPLTRRIFGMR